MSAREWKPGEVAMVLPRGGDSLVGMRTGFGWEFGTADLSDKDIEDVRPLAVIDSEDREAVERLGELFGDEREKNGGQSRLVVGGWADAMQAALREFANPKPEVFRHYIGSSNGGLKTALCGKVWRLNAEANVTVMGDCETCLSLVASGWSA